MEHYFFRRKCYFELPYCTVCRNRGAGHQVVEIRECVGTRPEGRAVLRSCPPSETSCVRCGDPAMVAEAAAGGARATVQRSGDRHPGQTILAVSGELQLAQTTVELKLHELIFE